jgi:hypothetical protein
LPIKKRDLSSTTGVTPIVLGFSSDNSSTDLSCSSSDESLLSFFLSLYHSNRRNNEDFFGEIQ